MVIVVSQFDRGSILNFALLNLSYSVYQMSNRKFLHYRFGLRSRCIRHGTRRNLSIVHDLTVSYQLTLMLGFSSLPAHQNITRYARYLDCFFFGVEKQYHEFDVT